MLNIGIIDDKEEERSDIAEVFETAFAKHNAALSKRKQQKFETVSSPPLPLVNDYPAWIYENKLSALIIDEKLREMPPDGYHIDYDGHDVIDYVKTRMLTLPVIVVTNVPDDQDLDKRFAKVDDIIPKAVWGEKGEKIAERLINRAENYKGIYIQKLAVVDKLSQKVALGTASEEDIEHLRGLQTEFSLPFIDGKLEIDSWLSDMENTLREFSELEEKAKSFIEKHEK